MIVVALLLLIFDPLTWLLLRSGGRWGSRIGV